MRIRAGYRISYDCTAPVPMLLALSLHPSREADLLTPQDIRFNEGVTARSYRDSFGNVIHRVLAPEGRFTVSTQFTIHDSGAADEQAPEAAQVPVEDLPDDALQFLLGSRYCETDKLSDVAWSLFGGTRPGWERVKAIVAFAHERIEFGYHHARSDKTAMDGYNERKGVCRDFAHLSVALCRCMNIPARYCTGYLGDIGVPVADSPMDFSAWFDVFLRGPGGPRGYRLAARHKFRRRGGLRMARGGEATDVALSTAFGSARLAEFEVVTDELKEG